MLPVLTALLTVTLAAPQESPPKHVVPTSLQARIDDAIDGGVEALLAEQLLDGSWTSHMDAYSSGATALAIYTLLKSDVPPSHPGIVAGLEFIRRHLPDKTYSRSCAILALTANGSEDDEELVERLTEELIETQRNNGWGYPHGAADLSNTQFAALALRAAADAGVRIKPRVWEDLAEAAVAYVERDEATRSGRTAEGFRYRPDGGHATGSMTGAGVSILAICLEHMRGRTSEQSRALERGKQWLAKHLSVEKNPAPATDSGQHGHFYYYLYGLERVGALLEVDLIGEHPWYRLGAEKLVGDQKDNGVWGGQPQTCFALLFLSRATGHLGPVSGVKEAARNTGNWTFGEDDPKADVSLRGSGRGEVALWVSSFSERARTSYGVGDDALIPVARVEYVLSDRAQPGVERVLAVVEADPESTDKYARYATRCSLAGPAVYDVYARLTLRYPEGTEVIESPPMEVRVPTTQRPEWRRYATDADRNELAQVGVVVTSSTRRDDGKVRPELVLDGYVGMGWKPTPEDAAPWIRLDLERPLRANRVLVSFASPGGRRFERYELIVNGDDDEDEILRGLLEPDGRLKTEIDLGDTVRVRSLELRFPVDAPGDWTPLGEIELQKVR